VASLDTDPWRENAERRRYVPYMEAPDRFAIGRVYRRSDLHDQYSGQRYGGISTPRSYPVILIFTGAAGLAHGYADEWDTDGVFHYFGEGQTGDMKFSGGNAAIRDHAESEKELHLFQKVESTKVRYLGEVICSGFEWETAKDSNDADRQAIVFQLVRASAVLEQDAASLPPGASLAELAAAADADPTEESGPKDGLRKTYARSEALKMFVRTRADGRCEGCGKNAPFLTKADAPYLEAHHTNRRSDTGPGNRKTVIALCPNCHCRVHYGKDGSHFNDELKSKLTTLETLP
jgi:5-methylcytosine-specific restriction enzyme A